MCWMRSPVRRAMETATVFVSRNADRAWPLECVAGECVEVAAGLGAGRPKVAEERFGADRIECADLVQGGADARANIRFHTEPPVPAIGRPCLVLSEEGGEVTVVHAREVPREPADGVALRCGLGAELFGGQAAQGALKDAADAVVCGVRYRSGAHRHTSGMDSGKVVARRWLVNCVQLPDAAMVLPGGFKPRRNGGTAVRSWIPRQSGRTDIVNAWGMAIECQSNPLVERYRS